MPIAGESDGAAQVPPEARRVCIGLLRTAGWRQDRRVSAEAVLRAYRSAGFEDLPNLPAFLEEFDSLRIANARGRTLWIDGAEALRVIGTEWADVYSRAESRVLVPIGGYLHAGVYLDSEGGFWGGFDSQFGILGKTVVELVYFTLIEPAGRPFHEMEV